MRPPAKRHNLAILRIFLELGQKEMAELAGRTRDTIHSIEVGRLELSPELARRISTATGVHFRWLIDNDLHAEIIAFDGAPYSRSQYEHIRGNQALGIPPLVKRQPDTLMEVMCEGYAASFYGQIRAMLSSAVERDLGDVAVWKLATFLQNCRKEFGPDST